MTEIDKKVIKFLISGKAYSDSAIMKNIGITKEELDSSFENLLKNGYIETYEDYLKRTNSDGKPACMSGCSGDCSACGIKIDEEDYKNIKVITTKAIVEFDF